MKKAPDAPLVDIPEAEQWRIIRESGVLEKFASDTPQQPSKATEATTEERLLTPFWEEFFAATALIIPHSFLLLMMEMYVGIS